ncbi:TonB-dependent receptor [Rhodocytophaga aerolata]|uniref:TonB-dependent receptor n=1 Tax=Rhodocytophaga aerolata TaxID=455078 RepID=A0ABT8RGZ6_9BACT|nr:TonB-dependent receptor [Rhodocytophaga aerolata]MDO1451382.1 TonB-dependent receptor [Rhodocytophaga aerolata]
MNEKFTHLPRAILLTMAFYMIIPLVFAQTLSMDSPAIERKKLQKQSLRGVLLLLKERYQVDIVFDDKLVNGRSIETDVLNSDLSFEEKLSSILNEVGLRYKKTRKDVYLVMAPKADKKTASGYSDKPDLTQDSLEATANQAAEKETFKGIEMQVAVNIRGRVSDENGNGMPGVSIVLKGTTIGTSTDSNGDYAISVPDEQKNGILLFSFIGYTTAETPINGQSTINVQLMPDIKTLSEVVVIGYGTQKQREVTGAVGSVTTKDIAGVAVTGLDQTLQGRIAGVQVTQNSGEPGGNVSVRIRGLGSINGSNEPLYIVDGVPYGSLNAINPNDIERIDVLKDAASAAIYGSRGSNGVVIVTTKRGVAGKVQVTLDAYAGIQSASRKLDLLNGPQFARLANENLVNGGKDPNPAWSNPSTVPNTDWQDQIFRPAPIQSYNVNISGGSEKSRSLVSVGYFDQGGIVAQSYYKRYTARINNDFDISPRFKVGLTLNGAFEDKRGTRTDGGNGSSTQGGLITAAVSQPTIPLVAPQEGLFSLNPDGSIDPTGNNYYGYDGTVFVTNVATPVWYPQGLSHPTYAYEKLREENFKSQEFLAAAFGEYELIKGLKVRSAINLTFYNRNSESFWKGMPVPILEGRGLYGSNAQLWTGPNQGNQWNWINTVSYGKSVGKHNLTALAGIDALKGTSQGISINTQKNPNDQPFVDGALFSDRTVSGGAPGEFALLSYLGRVTYDYAGKYLLTANIRRDGSSNFNPDGDYQYGVFPSVSVGWLMSEEYFMASMPFVSQLKMRASYGEVGNQGIPAFQYLSIYANEGNRRRYPLGLNQDPVVGFYQDRIGTADIRWETSTQANIGIDAAFLDNSISLTADYYVKKIDDMLGEFPLPAYLGVQNNRIIRNGFSMENSGIEIALGYNRQFGDLGFSTGVNFATLNNKVTKLTNNETGYVSSNISAGDDGGAETRTKVGEPVANFYGYVTDGIFQTQEEVDASAMSGLADVKPGDRRYKDLNGDGVINDRDRTIIGNGLPKYTFGFNMNVNFKGFDLSVLLNGQAGLEIANQTKYWLSHMKYSNTAGGINNGFTDLLESWTPENRSNTFTRNTHDAARSNRWFSDFNIENGTFLRVRNVQLGYTLPEAISRMVRMNRARIYVAAQNLFTFTEYSGYDPEMGSRVSNGRGNALQTGVDFGRYPVSRMFTGGINFQF